ncbi:hypothetical protein KP509_29G066300 [Ceratopteris richardii]|nr:hypothetical protein KP509_29G066300 [Ceratopteris richardii]
MPSSSTSISPRVKTPSPRAGRFLLRALSSSSSQSNPLPKTIGPMQHRVTIAASTPVSPAGSDPYSPTTHSASTTPTSRRSMRSFHRSAYSPVSHSGTVEWRRSVEQSRNRSLSAHLPSIRRRIRAYLMPEKLHPNSKEYSHVLDETSAHERTIRRSEQHHPHHRKQQNIFDAIDIRLGDEKSRRQQAISPSPAHQGHPTHAVIQKLPSSTMTARDQQMQWRRKLEMWGRDERARRRAAREEAEEDDIEVAERLLRVVKEHQYTMSPHRSYTKPNHRSAQQQSSHHSRTPKRFQEGGESAGDGVRGNVLLENGINVSRKSKRNSISPSPFRGSSPARFPIHAHKTENTTNSTSKWNQDGDFAYAYDSDSSSDLFEIETLNAFTYVAAQYRPRDLPIYSTRSPLRHDA